MCPFPGPTIICVALSATSAIIISPSTYFSPWAPLTSSVPGTPQSQSHHLGPCHDRHSLLACSPLAPFHVLRKLSLTYLYFRVSRRQRQYAHAVVATAACHIVFPNSVAYTSIKSGRLPFGDIVRFIARPQTCYYQSTLLIALMESIASLRVTGGCQTLSETPPFTPIQ